MTAGPNFFERGLSGQRLQPHQLVRITNLYWALSRRTELRVDHRIVMLNGEPGLLRYVDGQLESAQALVTDGSRIVAIYAVRNPDKLVGLPGLA